MVDDLSKLKEKLRTAGQEHVISFWDELNLSEQECLAKQIEQTDFNKLREKFELSKVNEYYDNSEVEPIPYKEAAKISADEKEYYTKIGEQIVKNEEVAVISMAGGQRYKTWVSWPESNI